jgi:hypothetical protein
VLAWMRCSQARRFVPGLKVPDPAIAFAYVSWTRSSASAGFPVSRSAAECSCRAYDSTWSANWSAG